MNEFEAVAARCMALAHERTPIQLPLWADDQRGAPAAILRSALFGVVKRGQRVAVENQVLAAWAGNEIRYTGFMLDQGDLDVWLQVLHLARQYPLGKDVRFTARSFLRAIGRNGGGNDLQWLQRSINRMQACGVRICVANGRAYQGSLIQNFFIDEESGRYVIRLDPLISELFDEDFVKLNMEKRLQLNTELSRWLQGYIQSHRATTDNPHRISVTTLRDLCGSSTSDLSKFRQLLKKDMTKLQNVGTIDKWRITKNDALEFIRPAS